MSGESDDPAGRSAPAPPGASHVVGPVPEGRDPVEYDQHRRRALWSLPSGLYLVGSRARLGGTWAFNLMTASLVVQVATDPKLVAVAIDREARTHQLVKEGKAFSVSLLHRGDRAIVRHFVKPVEDVTTDVPDLARTMNGEPVFAATTGAPILERAVAWLDCEVRQHLELGSHALFVGEVVDTGGTGLLGGHGALAEVLRMEDTRMSYGG